MSLFNRIGGRGPTGGSSSSNSNARVCPFYLEGRCKFGDSCKNYHPPRDGGVSTGASSKQPLPYHLTAEGVKADLKQGDDRPIWPLSAYGPGRDAPRQLLEGPIEQSPEELRVLYYAAKAAGSTQEYEVNERNAVEQANRRAQQISNDIDGALQYIINGKDQHPNRLDQVQKNAGDFNWTARPSYNQSNTPSSGVTAFGKPSSFGAASTSTPAFGKPPTPAFGQPSAPGTSTPFGGSNTGGSFGSGQAGTTSAFGRPSALGGGSGGSAFGQASTLRGASTGFGKPSALGGASPFGAQTTSTTSPFGQAASSNAGTSPFGQAAATTGGSTFGQASAPGGNSTFGKASAPAGNTTFGQSSAPGSTTAFGKPSPFGAAAPSAPAFGSSTPFGAQVPSSTSAFGQPSQPGQQASPFGQSAQPAQQQSTLGRPAPFGSTGGPTSTFGQSTALGASSGPSAFGKVSGPNQQTSAFGAATTTNGSTGAFGSQRPTSNPPFGSTAPTAPGQRLTTFKGQRVTYQRLEKKDGKVEDPKEYPFYLNPTTNKLERIFLPDGPPGPNPDAEAPLETYEALGTALKQVYDYVLEHGTFKDGVMPEVPPKREWVNWEL